MPKDKVLESQLDFDSRKIMHACLGIPFKDLAIRN